MKVECMKVTFALLAFMVIVFIAVQVQFLPDAIGSILQFDPSHLQLWMFVTSIFVHASFPLIAFNAVGLIMFGPALERRLGEVHFLALFLLAGIAGNVVYYAAILAGMTDSTVVLGVSGAVYGILGALCTLDSKLPVFSFLPSLNIMYATAIWFIAETALGYLDPTSGFASFAHIGGLGLGLGYARWREDAERGNVQIANVVNITSKPP